MTSSFLDTPIGRVTPEETLAAANNIKGYAIRTPLVKLDYRRPDNPNLEIWLKLETLQPINSFKLRGAVNKIKNVSSTDLQGQYDNLIVSASAGNMGQGVAYAAQSLGCECIVVVPDHAPSTKLAAMSENYGAQIIKVPFSRWWEIIVSGNADKELNGRKYLFVHPVCDPLVVAGSSTIGLEILEDMPDCDAVFCAWGGGGCSSGIGSALKNAREQPKCFPSLDTAATTDIRQRNIIDMISVEPATAAPLCYSFNNGKTLTPLPENLGDPNAYKASWIDGCGGKSVLKPMWGLAKDVLTAAYRVELEAVERALQVLVEKNRIVAEGAGACPVAAAMFGPVKPNWKRVVAVVCGGCIDTKVLTGILHKDFAGMYRPAPGFSFTQPIQKNAPRILKDPSHIALNLQVVSAAEVCKLLPMKECIEAIEQALKAFASGIGIMPLRQVIKLPFTDMPSKLGFFGSMPSYTNGLHGGDYASCKCISVFPQNSQTNGRFSSHQGVVLLWNKDGNGELLLIADAHEITRIRTAAASAVATRRIIGKSRCKEARVLSILGTGCQALSHIDAMREILPNLEDIRIWGRDSKKMARLKEKSPAHRIVTCHQTVASCVENADVICTVTSSTTPILTEEHQNLFKPRCHVNAVGACTPQFRELSPEIFQKSFASAKAIYTDSVDACLKEPGDFLDYNKTVEGDVDSNLVGIGDVLVGKESVCEEPALTVFKSLGIALEDLFAAKLIYERIEAKV